MTLDRSLYPRSFLGGVLAGGAMSVGLAILDLFRTSPNFELMLGTWFLDPGRSAWVLGLVMHLALSGVFGLLYGVVFKHFLGRATPGLGVLIGMVHGTVSGLLMGIVPEFHPRVPELFPEPGFWMANIGTWGSVTTIVLHLVFGAIVGAVIAAPYRRAQLAENATP
jgi:uncharacterized membrane protein